MYPRKLKLFTCLWSPENRKTAWSFKVEETQFGRIFFAKCDTAIDQCQICPPDLLVPMPSRLQCTLYFLLTWDGLVSGKGEEGLGDSTMHFKARDINGSMNVPPQACSLLESNHRKNLHYFGSKELWKWRSDRQEMKNVNIWRPVCSNDNLSRASVMYKDGLK